MSGDATIAGCVRRIVMHALELEAREMEPERKARLMRIRELRKQGYSWADAKHMAGSRRANS